MQYIPYLERAGLDVEVFSFFQADYVKALSTGHSKLRFVTGSTWRRLKQLRQTRHADLVWVEYEAVPWLPWLLEARLIGSDSKIVSDYDDAIYHRYDLHRSLTVRSLLGGKIGKVMKSSRLVIAGNPYIAQHATEAGTKRIEIVPTVLDTAAYQPKLRDCRGAVPVIGWIGSPSTWPFVLPVANILSDLVKEGHAFVTLIGAGPRADEYPRFNSLVWSEAEEVSMIQQMDIGIMPLPDTPWSRGKCGYKLIQYMACGLPVIASPVGVNSEIVEHGVNGFLASTDAEWRDALNALLKDADLRRRMGAAGRRKVEAQYSLQVWGPRVANMLKDVAEGRSG